MVNNITYLVVNREEILGSTLTEFDPGKTNEFSNTKYVDLKDQIQVKPKSNLKTENQHSEVLKNYLNNANIIDERKRNDSIEARKGLKFYLTI